VWRWSRLFLEYLGGELRWHHDKNSKLKSQKSKLKRALEKIVLEYSDLIGRKRTFL